MGLARVTKGWDPSGQIPFASGWIPVSQSKFSGLMTLFSTNTDELESRPNTSLILVDENNDGVHMNTATQTIAIAILKSPLTVNS